MTKRSIDVMVGLFVVLGVLAIAFLALKVANLTSFSSAPTYELKARFDNIGGLKPRAPVKSAGVVIGRIVDIRFDDESYQALVTMTLNQAYRFPKDSSAKIMTAGLLGEQFIGLEPGGDSENLVSGDTIKMTQSAIVLENLIGQFLYGKAAEGGQK
ncbi:MAG: outer membrane lipid asymmetry maintenance protein MlaD [Burkholderiaceae bacterium]